MITYKNDSCEVNYNFKSLRRHMVTFTRIGVDGAHFITLKADFVWSVQETLSTGATGEKASLDRFPAKVKEQIRVIFGGKPDYLLSDSPELPELLTAHSKGQRVVVGCKELPDSLAAYSEERGEVLFCQYADGWSFLLVPKEAILHYDDGVDVAMCKDRVEQQERQLAELEAHSLAEQHTIEKQIKDLEEELEKKRASLKKSRQLYLLDIEAAKKALKRAERESA